MERKTGLLQRIPAILSSKISIYIYLFLFFYLVLYALVCLVVPALNIYAPSDDVQLVMGNYTNVLSALRDPAGQDAPDEQHDQEKA